MNYQNFMVPDQYCQDFALKSFQSLPLTCRRSAIVSRTESRILIVEDEAVARARLDAIVTSNPAYQVASVASAGEALAALQSDFFDIVLLDIHLPDSDNFELAALIGSRLDIGLIIISAADDPRSRLEGLRSGADDYLCKPYNGEELLLKIARLAKRIHQFSRSAATPNNVRMRFGPWIYDPAAMALFSQSADEPFKLSAQENRLLLFFLNNPGRVFTRQYLLDVLHQDDCIEVYDRAIDSAIARLRRRIEPDPRKPRMLKTVYGEGYVFEVTVQRLDF